MKHRWQIKFETEDLTLCVYVEAVSVHALSHERIKADGLIIDLPGNIVELRVGAADETRHG
jgi:hypothetical protein